jgi:hypothetical protein
MSENTIKPGIRRYFSKIGRKGGLVKSDAKAKAVRQNGLKGGRPRKPDPSGDKAVSAAGK